MKILASAAVYAALGYVVVSWFDLLADFLTSPAGVRLRADWAAHYDWMCRGVESVDYYAQWAGAHRRTGELIVVRCYLRPGESLEDASMRAFGLLQERRQG
jgi:hypothetical protein